jgi:hypothetical protein
VALGVSFCAVLSSLAEAQPAVTPVIAFTRPTAQAARIDTSEAPAIDGDLSDAAWAKAVVIDKFTQKQPNPGQPPTERTVLRIMFDENNLYFGVYNYDSQPEAIIARSMQRDGPLYTADSFVLQIDPYQSRRNAYSFEVGASGGRTDELELNNTLELTEWNAIWTAKVRRVPDGWVAEVAIPFRSLSYDPNQTTWGFDFSRRIRHKNERIYWSSSSPTLGFTDISQNGDLAGITDIERGLGLDVQVYGALRAKHDWQVAKDGLGLSFTAGGNAFYKITPALTNTLTVNPDFSDAPLDIRQVNTTRFSLFTPETRDFFLQDVAAFDFGGHNFARNSNDRANNNGRPFFSRNIGLVRGVPVSLLVGDKVSGQFAGFDVGALSVLTDRTPTSSGQVLSVLRMRRPIFSESKIGFIVTNGDPSGLSRNTVAGVDYQYRDSNFLGGYIFESEGFYQRSLSNTKGDDDSAAISFNLPDEPWGGDFIFKQVGEHFFPALGFVNRLGIRQYEGTLYHLNRYRNTFLNQLEFGSDYEFVTDIHNALESRANDVYVRAASSQGDEVTLKVIDVFEDVPAPFLLPRNVPILPGRYEWTNIDARIRSFDGRLIRIDWEVMCCSFYSGDQLYSKLQIAFRPNAYFEFVPTWEATLIREPQGSVGIHILSLDSIINFIPDMQLAIQAQFDNISRGFGFSARYVWEYEPGNQILFAIGHSALIPGTNFVSQRTQATLRLIHTFRF